MFGAFSTAEPCGQADDLVGQLVELRQPRGEGGDSGVHLYGAIGCLLRFLCLSF